MIVLDLEMSGVQPEKHGIWQIGAMDLDNPDNYFIEEAHIDDDEQCDPQALTVVGKTEQQLRDKTKQSQKELLQHFFKWAEKISSKNFIGQNPGFDLIFIQIKSRKHGLEYTLPYRSFDIHSIAAIKYYQIHNKFLLKKDNSGSAMDLTNVLEFCGIKDLRRSIDQKTKKVIREGTPHNALEDAKLTAECFSRLVYSKELLPEFKAQRIPDYLLPQK